MLVDHRAEVVPAQPGARAGLGQGQRNRLGAAHAVEIHRHGEGRGLALGDPPGAHAVDEERDLLGSEHAAVTLLADDLLGQHPAIVAQVRD